MITSPGGAVHDVLSVLGRRFPLLPVDILPVPVQGAGAAAQIADTVKRASESGRYDALLVTRGGGSLEDLWAFNEEVLAQGRRQRGPSGVGGRARERCQPCRFRC